MQPAVRLGSSREHMMYGSAGLRSTVALALNGTIFREAGSDSSGSRASMFPCGRSRSSEAHKLIRGLSVAANMVMVDWMYLGKRVSTRLSASKPGKESVNILLNPSRENVSSSSQDSLWSCSHPSLAIAVSAG